MLFAEIPELKFIYPDTNDTSFVDLSDIVLKLPSPIRLGGLKELQHLLCFQLISVIMAHSCVETCLA